MRIDEVKVIVKCKRRDLIGRLVAVSRKYPFDENKYYAHYVTSDYMDTPKVPAKDFNSFIGFLNFYRHFRDHYKKRNSIIFNGEPLILDEGDFIDLTNIKGAVVNLEDM